MIVKVSIIFIGNRYIYDASDTATIVIEKSIIYQMIY